LTGLTAKGRSALYARLLVHGPDDLAAEALDDRRYWDDLVPKHVGAIVARHELAAYELALHAVRPDDPETLRALTPFLDAEVARLMIVHSDGARRDPILGWPAHAWVDGHGTAVLPYALPYALGEPGRDRRVVEAAIRGITVHHGRDAVVEAAAHHGGEAVRAMKVLRYPPGRHGMRFPLGGLPRVLLRDRRRALPAASVEHLVTLLSWLDPERPRRMVQEAIEEVVEACDPGSLADFAWGLYQAESDSLTLAARWGSWASDGVRYALERFGDDRTAARLADVVARWSSRQVRVAYSRRAAALRVFTALGSDAALRMLDRLGREAADQTRIGPGAREAMREIAERRGLTGERLAARLVPDFGLDAEGGMTFDYGPRGFRVGFDERLRPYVIDADGERHASLPKPGPKDDKALATAAREHFAEMREEAPVIAADEIGRLEEAMLTGGTWTVEDFRAAYLDHPLLFHIARRLVWSAGGRSFRIAEDRGLADVDDRPFTLPEDGEVSLPHPPQLGGAHGAWTQVFAAHAILQPFPQLGRPVFRLAEEERAACEPARPSRCRPSDASS
jgi:hypothetical protein